MGEASAEAYGRGWCVAALSQGRIVRACSDPNGAGKTTTIRCSARCSPRRGSGSVWDLTLCAACQVRRHIGVFSPGSDPLLAAYRPRELGILAALYEMLRQEYIPNRGVAQLVDLTGRADDLVERYSTACANGWRDQNALHDRGLLLDERRGIDPQASRSIRDLIPPSSRRRETILLTRIRMEEADQLCERWNNGPGPDRGADSPLALKRASGRHDSAHGSRRYADHAAPVLRAIQALSR